jgi:hypothetical protein
MLKAIRTIIVAVMLGHAVPANADIYQLVRVGGDNIEEVAYQVLDASGNKVAVGRTDYLGRFEVKSAPGTYHLIAQWGRTKLPPIDIVVDGGRNLKLIQIK